MFYLWSKCATERPNAVHLSILSDLPTLSVALSPRPTCSYWRLKTLVHKNRDLFSGKAQGSWVQWVSSKNGSKRSKWCVLGELFSAADWCTFGALVRIHSNRKLYVGLIQYLIQHLVGLFHWWYVLKLHRIFSDKQNTKKATRSKEKKTHTQCTMNRFRGLKYKSTTLL